LRSIRGRRRGDEVVLHLLDFVAQALARGDRGRAVALERTRAETDEEEGADQKAGVATPDRFERIALIARDVLRENVVETRDVVVVAVATGLRLRRSGNERPRGHLALLPLAEVFPHRFEAGLGAEEGRDPAVARENEVAEEDLFLFRFEQVVLTDVAQIDAERIVRRRGLHGFRFRGRDRFDQRLLDRELVLLSEDRIVVQELGSGLFLVLDWHDELLSGDRIDERASSASYIRTKTKSARRCRIRAFLEPRRLRVRTPGKGIRMRPMSSYRIAGRRKASDEGRVPSPGV
jgi:hypothetical protein